jgi:heat shock protein HslJ
MIQGRMNLHGAVAVLAAALLGTAGCTVAPVAIPAIDQPPGTAALAWLARGNEPGWRLEMAGGGLAFETADGQIKTTGRAGDPQVQGDTTTYTASTTAGSLTAVIVSRRCQDSMSGMPYPQTVAVDVQGRRFQGCGGDPAELLRGDEWVVEDIAGGGIVDGSRVTVQFGPGDRVTGRASCNRYTGGYALSGEGLQLKGLASTRMACAPALNQQETRFLQILGQVVRHEFTADGALVLVASDGRRLRARRG